MHRLQTVRQLDWDGTQLSPRLSRWLAGGRWLTPLACMWSAMIGVQKSRTAPNAGCCGMMCPTYETLHPITGSRPCCNPCWPFAVLDVGSRQPPGYHDSLPLLLCFRPEPSETIHDRASFAFNTPNASTPRVSTKKPTQWILLLLLYTECALCCGHRAAVRDLITTCRLLSRSRSVYGSPYGYPP